MDVPGSAGGGHHDQWAVKLIRCGTGSKPACSADVTRGYLTAMFTHTTRLRVRYGETDRMGYMYYGDYAQYFEVGRVEALRSLGFPYRDLEDDGIMLPVHDMQVRYHRPARYDDMLTLRTHIDGMPSVRIVFRYELLDETGILLTEASITLVFVDRATMRPRRAPEALLNALAPYFS